MNDVITIENTEMQIKEYNGQRVVTFKDIDAVHNRKSGTARKRFNENKNHFIIGEDYFVRKTDEALTEYGITAPNGLILITETGYLMLVKSFRDDLAWKVQRQLVNSYFKLKEIKQDERDDLIADFPEYPKEEFKVSTTPVPKNPNWYKRNIRLMRNICSKEGVPLSTLYHHILMMLGEQYDLDAANRIYQKEMGHAPLYAMDVVSYFPELAELASNFIRNIAKSQEKMDKGK